jgi:hypothetical protein
VRVRVSARHRGDAVGADALIAVAQRGVVQHLAQLDQPELRSRLEKAAADLESLGQNEAAADLQRMLQFASAPERADPTALGHLLAGSVHGLLRQVLRGGEVVARRDLAALREDLAGRRYPRRRLLELLRAWVDGPEGLGEQAIVEVEDSAEGPSAGAARWSGQGPTVDVLQARFPALAAQLPFDRPAEAFWLAAWWRQRPHPPAWLPAQLLEGSGGLQDAARALLGEAGPRRELAELDAKVQEGTLLGDQVEAALDLGRQSAVGVMSVLLEERTLRLPVRLAAAELLRRVAADLPLAERLPSEALARLATEHGLLADADLRPLDAALAAARSLAAVERDLGSTTAARLVEEVYPVLVAPVTDRLSEAIAGWPLLGAPPDGMTALEGAASRVLGEVEQVFADLSRGGFQGCLQLWQVGERVIAPLLHAHGRVAVLLVDGMRADLWLRLRGPLAEALPQRHLRERWAVVTAPTRTAEAVTSLARGRPVAAGEVEEHGELPAPFAHLGYQTGLLVGADRDRRTQDLLDLWRDGPPLSVAVATGVDERLHHSPVDLAALLTESVAALKRAVLPTLQALPAGVPLVVMADHGFRENRSWGRGAVDRYAHGGPSVAESVVPVAVLEP